MHTLGAIKQSRFWAKLKLIISEILTEESILNHPMEELARDFKSYTEKLFSYLDRNLNKLEKINWRDLEKKLESYAQEPFSKITTLALANVLVFVWMAGNGIFVNLLPEHVNIYVTSALGAENEETSFSPGLKIQDNKILEPKADPENNSFSEVKCEKDKEENRCSDLCADIERYIKVTKDMSEEEKRDWEKAAEKVRKGKILRGPAVSTGRISCREANNGHPRKSSTKGKHMDEDCCPDPDEWPKSGCVYNAAGLALMLKGPR
jgi:hypothetical protein